MSTAGHDFTGIGPECDCGVRPDRHRHVAPDRPGDRDQQQAAEVLRQVDRVASGTAARAAIAAALATTRAEEAARWRAKIEALRGLVEEWSGFGEPEFHDAATALSAVLDGEQR